MYIFGTNIVYQGNTYEQEQAKEIENDLLQRREYPSKECCKESVDVGEISQIVGPRAGRNWAVWECPTCKKIDLKLNWLS